MKYNLRTGRWIIKAGLILCLVTYASFVLLPYEHKRITVSGLFLFAILVFQGIFSIISIGIFVANVRKYQKVAVFLLPVSVLVTLFLICALSDVSIYVYYVLSIPITIAGFFVYNHFFEFADNEDIFDFVGEIFKILAQGSSSGSRSYSNYNTSNRSVQTNSLSNLRNLTPPIGNTGSRIYSLNTNSNLSGLVNSQPNVSNSTAPTVNKGFSDRMPIDFYNPFKYLFQNSSGPLNNPGMNQTPNYSNFNYYWTQTDLILYHGTKSEDNARDIISGGGTWIIGSGNQFGTGLYMTTNFAEVKNYTGSYGAIIEINLVVPFSQIADYNEVNNSSTFSSWRYDFGTPDFGDDLASYTVGLLKKRYIKVSGSIYVALAPKTIGNERLVFEGLDVIRALDVNGYDLYL